MVWQTATQYFRTYGVAAGLGLPRQQVADALAAAGLDPRVRPEQLTLEHFAALDAALRAAGPSAG